MLTKQAIYKPDGPKYKNYATQPSGQVTPFDISKLNSIGPTVGLQFVSFSVVDVGGENNLLPGFVKTASNTLTWPSQAQTAIVMMKGFGATYVDGNGNIDDHNFGELAVHMYFSDDHTVACDFLLRDDGTSEGINCWSDGMVLYFLGASA
jgi:hypothetical protein